MNEPDVIRALVALGHPSRLQVFRALVITGEEGMTPGVMQQGLDISPTALSFHLKELTGAGLVTQERVGRNIIYRAEYDQMRSVLGYLTENCCQGADCAINTVGTSCKV